MPYSVRRPMKTKSCRNLSVPAAFPLEKKPDQDVTTPLTLAALLDAGLQIHLLLCGSVNFGGALGLGAVLIKKNGLLSLLNHGRVNDAFLDAGQRRQAVHDIEHDLFHHISQAAGTRLALDGLVGQWP